MRVQSQDGSFTPNSPPQRSEQGDSWKRVWKEGKTQSIGRSAVRYCLLDLTLVIAHMNSQEPWSAVPDLYNIKPFKTLAWIEEGLPRPHPQLRSSWQLIAVMSRIVILLAVWPPIGCPFSSGQRTADHMGSTNLIQWAIKTKEMKLGERCFWETPASVEGGEQGRCAHDTSYVGMNFSKNN